MEPTPNATSRDFPPFHPMNPSPSRAEARFVGGLIFFAGAVVLLALAGAAVGLWALLG